MRSALNKILYSGNSLITGMSKHILKQYCTKKLRKIKHRKGFGVHSPFAYNLITKVVEESCSYYAYQQVDEIWRTQICNKLTQDDFHLRKPIPVKYGRLLFRLVNRFHPHVIVEYGTCWGISSLYLHLGNTQAHFFCIEPNSRIFEFSKKIMPSDADNIQFLNGSFSERLSECLKFGTPDFVFVHHLDNVQEYESVYGQLSTCLDQNTVLVVGGIHSTGEILDAWHRFSSDERIRVTMDLFDVGIAFCDPKLNKQDYIVAF